ncbi:MAG: M23 family metallopeptidase [Gemmatimonadaceae bacterium]
MRPPTRPVSSARSRAAFGLSAGALALAIVGAPPSWFGVPTAVPALPPVLAAAPESLRDAPAEAEPGAHGAGAVPWRTDTVVVRGVISSSLSDALERATDAPLPRAARAELAWTLADIFEYRVDMSRELQPGDGFTAVVARAVGPGGSVKLRQVLAARLDVAGSPVEAIRYQTGASRGEYFDGNGKSLRLAFLRAPVAFRRVSSAFGLRRHPILGIWKAHAGLDYAASAGTPIRSVGDGRIVYSGWRGGYGNVVEVRHRNGYISRYGHLRAFAKGARAGTSVAIGQTIGYVGMTGLATAPHLHFEVLVNGRQRDPRVALAQKSGFPIAASERLRFEQVRGFFLAYLDGPGASGEIALH